MKAALIKWITFSIVASLGSAGLITLSKKSNIQQATPPVFGVNTPEGELPANKQTNVIDRELALFTPTQIKYQQITKEEQEIENEPIDYETPYPQISSDPKEKADALERIKAQVDRKVKDYEPLLIKESQQKKEKLKQEKRYQEEIHAEKEFNVIPPTSVNPASFWERKFQKSINFIHFNDVYEIRFLPYWAKVLKLYTKMLNNPSIIFSGDIIGPSTVSGMLSEQQGVQFHKLFHDFRIDVSVPGNHEGDFGEENFKEFVKHNLDQGREEAYRKNSKDYGKPGECEHNYPKVGVDPKNNKGPVQKFPVMPGAWLLANVFRVEQPESSTERKGAPNWGNLRGAIILKINGFKVGFFGLVDEAWINGSTLKGVKSDYVITNFLKSARSVSKQLKDAGCHFVAAVTHMTNDDDEALLADKENFVDFVFGGHEHIFLIQRKNNRILIKSGADFKQFSAIRFELFNSKQELEESVNEANLRTDPHIVVPKSVDADFGPWVLDDLNSQQLMVRSWNFPIEYKFTAPKDNNGALKDPNDAVFEKYTHLNIFVERVDIKFDEKNGQDKDFLEDFNKNFFPFVKPLMKPAFHFQNPVDAREPQIYEGETPIGDFLTDVIKADTGADIVMLNAGSIKSEFAFPKDSTLPIADAKRMLQRPTPYVKTIPRLKAIRKLFVKNLQKVSSKSPNFPVFAGIHVDMKTKKGMLESLQFSKPDVWSHMHRIKPDSSLHELNEQRQKLIKAEKKVKEEDFDFLKQELEYQSNKAAEVDAKIAKIDAEINEIIKEEAELDNNPDQPDYKKKKEAITDKYIAKSNERSKVREPKAALENARSRMISRHSTLETDQEMYMKKKMGFEKAKTKIEDEKRRFSFVTLDFILNSSAMDPEFLSEIDTELEDSRAEWYKARMAADLAIEMRDYYDADSPVSIDNNKPKVPNLYYDLGVYEDLTKTGKRLDSYSNVLANALESGYLLKHFTVQYNSIKEDLFKNDIFDDLNELKALEAKNSPESEVVKNKKAEVNAKKARSVEWGLKKSFCKSNMAKHSTLFYFPASNEPLPSSRRRPYDSLEAFYDLSVGEFGQKLKSGIFNEYCSHIYPEKFQETWKSAYPSGTAQLVYDQAENWSKIVESEVKSIVPDKNNLTPDPILAKFRTIQDENLKRMYRFLSLTEMYNLQVISVPDLSSDNKSDKVEILSVKPVKRNRLNIEEIK